MPLKIYINGKLYDKKDAKISVYDHGLLYGDGVFEGIRSYGGRVFRLAEHLDRLWDSAKAIWLEIPISKEKMAKAIEDTLARSTRSRTAISACWSPAASAPSGSTPTAAAIRKSSSSPTKSRSTRTNCIRQGLKIVTVSVVRNHPAALSPRIKSLNYLNNILAKIEGLQAGCIEALLLNHKGEIAECTGDNIFLVRQGRILTPPNDAGILEGITRDAVIGLARQMDIEVREIPLTKHDVYIADECFLTGTAAEVVPVVTVDSRTIGDGRPGPITRKLMARFHELARS